MTCFFVPTKFGTSRTDWRLISCFKTNCVFVFSLFRVRQLVGGDHGSQYLLEGTWYTFVYYIECHRKGKGGADVRTQHECAAGRIHFVYIFGNFLFYFYSCPGWATTKLDRFLTAESNFPTLVSSSGAMRSQGVGEVTLEATLNNTTYYCNEDMVIPSVGVDSHGKNISSEWRGFLTRNRRKITPFIFFFCNINIFCSPVPWYCSSRCTFIFIKVGFWVTYY